MVRRAGKLRPSQLVTQFGPGSLVDLPELSMVLAGLDDWNTGTARSITEPRLQAALGVTHFRLPPYLDSATGVGGVPARIFPRFLVCPRCNRLAQHDKFEFTARGSKHLCKAEGCRGQGKAPAFPVRFMVACPNGHLDDFPWHYWVHPDHADCTSDLCLEDSGKTGSITDLWIRCPEHERKMPLAQAFGDKGRKRLPRCSGNRPWLADHDSVTCDESTRVLLRGASNAYFSVTASALSIPPWSDPIQMDVAPYVEQLAMIDSLEKLQSWMDLSNVPDLKAHGVDQVWEALQKLRGEVGDLTPDDLRRGEYAAFLGSAGPSDYRSEFKVSPEPVPSQAEGILGRVMRATRLREVRALRGFTRIDAVPDIGDMVEVEAIDAGLAPLARTRTNWLPGVDLRGEGIFITLHDDSVVDWEGRPAIDAYGRSLLAAQANWHAERGIPLGSTRTPRFALIHSLAHLLIRRLELEAGYSGASLRERLYCGDDMAGFLIYTATPDSEGTLGGLVELARPDDLGPMLARALEDARLCANDPLCASRQVSADEAHLNGAACHACLLLPETSCETGNHFLDRSLLVRTLIWSEGADAAYVSE